MPHQRQVPPSSLQPPYRPSIPTQTPELPFRPSTPAQPPELPPAVASHRRPARRFQVVGVFVLVVGALAGSYTALRPDSPPAPSTVDAPMIAAGTDAPDADALAYAKQKAEQAAKAEADKARRANEVAAEQEAARQADVPASCDAYSGNRALGCALLLDAGFGLDQMRCLDPMWTRESNWRVNAHNASSGAHGIPQALPASKMAAFGADYLTNPVTQIRWGLSYIEGRYGSPCKAWSFWQANGWY